MTCFIFGCILLRSIGNVLADIAASLMVSIRKFSMARGLQIFGSQI